MRLGILCALGLSLLAFTGCAGFFNAPIMPPGGWVYTEWKAPLDGDFANTELGAKMGKAETTSILGLVATGDASTKAAASAGGIKTVKHADYEFFNVLGVYSRFVTIVYGD